MPPQTGLTISAENETRRRTSTNSAGGAVEDSETSDHEDFEYFYDNGPMANKPNKVRFRDDFLNDEEWDEPHARRRKIIMEKHGDKIKKLFGVEPWTKWQTLIIVTLQITLAYLLKDTTNYWLFFFVMYFVGGTLTHMCSLGIHEISHFMAFEKELPNRLLLLFINLPLCVPASSAFRIYHMEHHKYQGVYGVDTDISTHFEAKRIKGKLAKLFNLVFIAAFYGLRPLVIRPKAITFWVAANAVVQVVFDLAIYYFFGLQGLVYLLLSTFFGLGIHPISGHYIQEHFVFHESGQETTSYYGILNKVMWNVGYHVEHHDFPRIPFTRLPELKKIAPEFYDNLFYHTSMLKVLWTYVMDDGFGVYNRVVRDMKGHNNAQLKTKEMDRVRRLLRKKKQKQQQESGKKALD